MGLTFTAKPKSKNSNRNETWGMGFLLVFFPEDNNNANKSAIADHKHKLFSSSRIRSSSISSNLILTKTQSTISLCALFLFLSLLLFTLSTFEPTLKTHPTPPRRFLSQKPHHDSLSITHSDSLFSRMWNQKPKRSKISALPTALQGMGTLFRRGTKAMADLVVCHVVEDVKEDEFRLFIRVLFRSGLTARSDLIFIFPSFLSAWRFESIILGENDSFLKLVRRYREFNTTSRTQSGIDVTRFLKVSKKEIGEPLWGKRVKSNSFNDSVESESTRLSYGSVVGFESAELDPENTFSGFLDVHVPMSFRRWACYPMLLGRVRRNFKNVMLVDVKNLVVLGDPLDQVRHRSPESVYIFMKPEASSGEHSKKNSDKTHLHGLVNSEIIMGGARGIRRLSNIMVTEVVRALMQHKKKNSVSESGVLSQLVGNQFILKNVNLIKSAESVPEASSLGHSTHSLSVTRHAVIQRGNMNHLEVIMKHLCSFEVDSSVYSDC